MPFPDPESSNKWIRGAKMAVVLLAAVQKQMHLTVAW